MKRQREDPHDYLGGDLATLDFKLDDDEGKRLTKAERNDARKIANKKWKLVGELLTYALTCQHNRHHYLVIISIHVIHISDRKVGSGKDPNPRHTMYYQAQLPELTVEGEWMRFQSALVKPLCVTFRLGSSCPGIVGQYLKHSMQNKFKTMTGRFIEVDGVALKENIVRRIGFLGAGCVWQVSVYDPSHYITLHHPTSLNITLLSLYFSTYLYYSQIAVDSSTLARNEGFERLSALLKREVELGHVVRQELASMIPALLLQVCV